MSAEVQVWAYTKRPGGTFYHWMRKFQPELITAQDDLKLNKQGYGHVPYRVIVKPRHQWTEHETTALVEQGMSPCL